jgi:tryptophan synthase alpha chain
MNRIEREFERLRKDQKKALVVYLTAGDPSLETTEAIILELDKAGVNILEIGVPFSDPTADGPVIQAASQRALQNGVTLENILAMIESVRKCSDIPIILFGYYNPIYRYGNEAFAARASAVGVDGILVVDLPMEESFELRRYTDRMGMDFISLIAPTTNDSRIERIVSRAKGFLYYITVTGVTGTAKPEPADIEREVKRIRRLSNLPVVAGFGISTPQQVAEIAPLADGIVIGSAIVRMIADNQGKEGLPQLVSSYIGEIRKALD